MSFRLSVLILTVMFLAACGQDRDAGPDSGGQTSSNQDPALPGLEQYGEFVMAATDGVVEFVSAIQTAQAPKSAYQLQFKTASEDLMFKPGATTGSEAYDVNEGITEAWSAGFCTGELKAIMAQHGIDTITGDLQDYSGETQSLSTCQANNGQ